MKLSPLSGYVSYALAPGAERHLRRFQPYAAGVMVQIGSEGRYQLLTLLGRLAELPCGPVK